MKTQRYGKIVLLILLVVQISFAALYSVAKDGVYKTVQSAIDAAGPGDIVQIEDLGVYEEQVTIDSTKSGLVLRSLNPTASKKPVIRFQDTKTVLPKTYQQSQHQDSINFDQNGALRVLHARGVVIDGIKVDGGGAYPWQWEAIWENKWPLFHGNAAITLWVAGDVVVRNCDITNAYFGINIKDRNEGGIFANANPADLDTWNIVPLAGFGRTGNHIIENNRIHDNSFGMFFESVWDQGSIIRYNLFYENHHTRSVASKVAGFEPEGNNQPGGALFFKDHMLSPLAIYNNTFWHNRATFVANWKVGGQHLIFNNIIAQPDSIGGVHQDVSGKFPARMHHSLYAAQAERPQRRTQNYHIGVQDDGGYVSENVDVTAYSQVRIMNSMDRVEIEGMMVTAQIETSTGVLDTSFFVEWAIQPGARITTPFGRNSTVRWFEMKFLSTDPESPDFLVPDWDDPDVDRLVLDKGWPEAGILDADGSIADLGAIPKAGRARNDIVIRAVRPVIIEGTTATIDFEVLGLDKASLSDLKIKYVRWVKGIPYEKKRNSTDPNAQPDYPFGPDFDTIPSSDVVSVDIPNTPISMGSNSVSFNIKKALGSSESYGYFELILEGKNADGEIEMSSVGFIPYRKVDYMFDVKVLDYATGKIELDSVRAGELVKISITPKRIGGGSFDNEVSPCTLTLSSGYVLYTENGDTLRVPSVRGTLVKEGYFTKVPSSGYDRVSVNGAYVKQIFLGNSKSIRILPGDPEKITFQNPPSKGYAEIPGFLENGSIRVEDKYGNAVGKGIEVKIKSTTPDIGDILKDDNSPAGGEDVVSVTDSTGHAFFKATVTEGDKGDTIPVIATLVENNATDNAKLIVGNKKPKFFILYSDTAKFDITVELNGCAGVKFPVTIIASTAQMGDSIIDTLNNEFNIDLPSGIAAYKTNDPNDTVRISSSALVKGKAKIWIKSTTGVQKNKQITITSKNDNFIIANTRKGINFDPCGPIIEKAAYFADNGDGQVDRLEMWYKEELEATEIPDSLKLYWPDEQPGFLRTVKKSDITLDEKNAKHIIVKIDPKFAKQITFTNKSRLGTSYWNDLNLPDASTEVNKFSIEDSVGPVLTYAELVEKLKGGDDTIFIRFSENVHTEHIEGITLTLVKKDGKKHDMKVLSARRLGDTTNTIKIVVEDLKENSPTIGDSLKILHNGTIVDLYNNRAHPDNRPVPLKLKQVPPNAKKAYYIDSDGDGIVDSVYVKLDKFIKKKNISATCVWEKDNNSTDTLDGDNMSHNSKDSSMIGINVKGKFHTNEVRTSGTMLLYLSFSEFENSTQKISVDDSAAPVIIKAVLIPGSYIESDDSYAFDTLRVTFSEETQYPVSVAKPFYLYRGNVQYTIDLQGAPKTIPNGFQFVRANKDTIEKIRYPENGDSIHINVNAIEGSISPFSDGANYQKKPGNRKVALEVKPGDTEVLIKAGPNPFVRDIQGVTFFIKPRAKMVENVEAVSTVIVYDQMGNKIWSGTDSTKNFEDRKIRIKWDGQNLKKRKVGKGTYLARVRTEYGEINEPKKVNVVNIPIGVKENN
jgi:hypothetical protein